ncbi:MAG TPA: hypothetical protein VKV18_14380 [Chthonomonas sp.]|uniref:hypothetical protein n=1 Tax=Chthonomonas sp. TaxID=2282153 RepID=UPI002B4B78C3|nr:hypothetical protein [Chthonomonas sp.]HLI49857.1 hypothetical protein [Chthonomonas sp.]
MASTIGRKQIPDYVGSERFAWQGRRVSQGAGQVLFGKGGLGYIARRGVDFGTSMALQSLEGVARLAAQQPLELLSLLPDLVPEVGLALWNGVHLGCNAETVRLKALTRTASGSVEESAEGTALLEVLWRDNSPEVGGFEDALAQNFQMLMFAGMCAVEAVPASRGKGIAAVYPVNTLTLRYRRDDDGVLRLYQQQIANPNGMGLYAAGFGGLFVPMPMERFFTSRIAALPDEPYGRAPFGAALTVVLECLAFWRDVMLAFHRIGTPKWDVGFDFEMWANLAREVVGLTDPLEINEYVQARFQEAVAFWNDLKADDAFFHDKNTVVNAAGSREAWPDVGGLWQMLRLRLVQALKQLPTLMGIVEGSTETWSRVEWDIYTAALRTLTRKAAAPLQQAGALHLRLLGLPYWVELEIKELKSVTRLTDAQAEAVEIANEARKRDEGWQTNETAAVRVTGSGPAVPHTGSRG